MKAVTYDFWDTLMWEVPGTMRELRRAAINDLVGEFGLRLQAGAIERELLAISALQRDAWTNGRIFQPSDGAAHFGEAIAGGELSHDQRTRMGEALFLSATIPDLNVAEGIADALRQLHASGVRLAIVCDVGLTPSTVLRECLEDAGILQYFDGWAFSDEVGCYKPAHEIFEHALDAIGVGPEDAIHVGDLRRTDVAGSRAIGMTSVRYRGVSDDSSKRYWEADHVIDHHSEIFSVLK